LVDYCGDRISRSWIRSIFDRKKIIEAISTFYQSKLYFKEVILLLIANKLAAVADERMKVRSLGVRVYLMLEQLASLVFYEG